ncbi:hypothetical protein PENSPDRAFT_672624 [Peniophora sp. CONT]|nr:hypothetical protein PENSPDRAFT_672624 [Peniophora sp. CONT]
MSAEAASSFSTSDSDSSSSSLIWSTVSGIFGSDWVEPDQFQQFSSLRGWELCKGKSTSERKYLRRGYTQYTLHLAHTSPRHEKEVVCQTCVRDTNLGSGHVGVFNSDTLCHKSRVKDSIEGVCCANPLRRRELGVCVGIGRGAGDGAACIAYAGKSKAKEMGSRSHGQRSNRD